MRDHLSKPYIVLFAVWALAGARHATADDKPQWQRLLEGDDAKQVAELQQRISAAEQADSCDEAIAIRKELLALRRSVQGADHWETVSERWEMGAEQIVAALPAEERAAWRKALAGADKARQLEAKGRYVEAQPDRQEFLRRCENVFVQKHPLTAVGYNNLAMNLDSQGKFAQAQPLLQKALDLRLELLGEKHPYTAASYNNLAFNFDAQRKYAEAQPLYQKALDLRIELLGEKHPHTAAGYSNLGLNVNAQGRYADAELLFQKALELRLELLGEKHPDTAVSYGALAHNLNAQGKYAEAAPLNEKALELNRELLGEKHPDTAVSYSNLAGNLGAQGKYAEARTLYQKVLERHLELFGEKHLNTAISYSNLAHNLNAQGKYAEAAPLFQQALKLRLELFGEKHPDTALSYNNLAFNLHGQGKYAEAQPLYQRALELRLELLGEKHPDTAHSYNNLAGNLDSQGKYAEAQPLLQKALDLRLELLGEKHPDTAGSYNNLAVNLNAQRMYADAEPLFRRALELRLELFGEKHPDTAQSYNNLAGNLAFRGKYAEAQSLFQRAFDLNRELLGEKHPNTANGYANLAANLGVQGKYAEAAVLFQKALALNRELLGEQHPATAQSYNSLAANLNAQGQYAEAATQLLQAATSYEAARLALASGGLGRAPYAEQSPYRYLAATEAELGDPRKAWGAVEADLARGLADEVAARRGTALTAEERERQVAMAQRLNDLAPRIVRLVTQPPPGEEEQNELAKLKAERRQLEGKLADLAVALSQREIATPEQVQQALAPDAALLGWVDASDRSGGLQDHWGYVVRHSGEPVWERLHGSGANDAWTSDDATLVERLRAAAAGSESIAKVRRLAAGLAAQRLAPLEKHLQGVKRLFVVPVRAMAGIPMELLANRYTVSYVPSGTFLARWNEHPAATGSSLLALGDAVFPPVEPPKDTPLPAGGLLITQVLPESNAAQARLQPGNVLLRYAGAELISVEQLGKLIQEHGGDTSIAVLAWREGETAERELAPGKLGVVIDRQPAPQALTAKRKTIQMLLALARGGNWAELPGSAVEVSRLKMLVEEGGATILTGSAASEQELEQLRANGKLAKFRYLHFATHAEPNNARSFESALILSQDQISKDMAVGGGKFYDGRLTANEVLENWQLNADLVTLSACESALGRPGGGDGLLGFAQAFLLAGARSVCLSLWKVDDTATALLMDRFYQNLLGKRDGLVQSMPKAEALAEAKRWLRDLTTDDATKLTADLTAGVARGKGEPGLNLVMPRDELPNNTADDHPFAHPRYWAAFILIGDPN